MLSLEQLSSGYHTVIVATVDAYGRLLGRYIPLRHFLTNPEQGIRVCANSMLWDISQDMHNSIPFAAQCVGFNDLAIRPELPTLRPYPGLEGTAICMGNLFDRDGNLLEIAPRTVLRHQVERAKQSGYELRLASELEFYLFRGDTRAARLQGYRDLELAVLDRSGYDVVKAADQERLICKVRNELEKAGIPVCSSQGDYGISQWEINLEHSAAMENADRHAIYKATIKTIASQLGLAVTFMAKPIATDVGSSCHFHCSLWTGDQPAFPDRPGSATLSAIGRGFLGGLLAHLDETAVLFAPYVNSYKRHKATAIAGNVKAWGIDNRTVVLRVLGAGEALRIEHRYAGADVNPYLATAALIAAGLDGIERSLDPGSPIIGDASAQNDLPRTASFLGEATEKFAHSQFAISTLGEDVVAHYVAHARAELDAYLSTVTDWELTRAFDLA